MEGESSIFLFAVGLIFLLLSSLLFLMGSISIRRSGKIKLLDFHEKKVFGSSTARLVISDAEYYLISCQAGELISVFLAGIFALLVVKAPCFSALSGDLASLNWLVKLVFLILVLFIALVLNKYTKALVYSYPERVLCFLSYPLIYLGRFSYPLVFAVRIAASPFVKLTGLEVFKERDAVVSAEEISEIVQKSTRAGEIEEDECDMIQGVFEFSDTVVREVMTPRMDVVWVSLDASLDEVIDVFTREGLSRILVIGDDLDDLKGVLLAKDLIPLVGKEKTQFNLKSLIRSPYTVPNTRKIDDLLQEFQGIAVHLAVVLDEHGGVDGVVTVEDLIEEIVGDIFDEYDTPEEEIDHFETQSGDLVLDGGALIDELNESYSLGLPEGEYDTIAGFVIQSLGRIPEPGVEVRYNGHRISIEEVVCNRITKLKITSSENHGEVEEESEASDSSHSDIKIQEKS